MVTVYAKVSSTVIFSYDYGEKLHVGEDAQDALPFQVIFCKRAIEFVAMLWKETCKLSSVVILSHDYGVSRHLRIPLLW